MGVLHSFNLKTAFKTSFYLPVEIFGAPLRFVPEASASLTSSALALTSVFPEPAVTKYHKLGGFQHTFVLL